MPSLFINENTYIRRNLGSSEIHWLELSAFTAGAPGSIPNQGTKILQAVVWPKKIERKEERHLITTVCLP